MTGILEKLRAKLNIARLDAEVKSIPAQAAPGGRLASTPPALRTHRVYTGLDFGTCSCKAIVQVDPEDRKQRRFLAVAHPSATNGASPLRCPSTVDVRGDQFFFGYQAEEGGSSQAVRSFKMCMPCLWRHEEIPGGCPRCRPEKPGHFMLGGSWWTAEELSILFLAHVIHGVRDSVLNHLAGEPAQFFINSAAPLDQMPQDSELGRSFQRVLYFANQLRDLAKNPWPIAEARAALDAVGHRHHGVPDLADSPTTVFPETHAAMTSVLAPLDVNRNFGTVDIGAGTTDVAFFYYHRTSGEPEACYYQAKSRFVGMDQLDAAVVGAAPGGLSVRAWREELSTEQLTRLAGEFEKPIEEMFRHFRTRFGESYVRNPGFEYWSDLTIFLTGGGSQFAQIVRRFGHPFVFIVGERTVTIDLPNLPDSVHVLSASGSTEPMNGRYPDKQLLLLAYGLAHGAANIAKWIKDYAFFRDHAAGNGGLVAEVPYTEI